MFSYSLLGTAVLLLILGLYPSHNAFAEWQWLSPQPQGNNLADVAWSEELGLAVSVGQYGTIITSKDGKTWNRLRPITNVSFSNVLWDGKQFVALGTNRNGETHTAIITSLNGSDWTIIYETRSFLLFDIAWSGQQYMAVGYDSQSHVQASEDLITWRPVTLPRQVAVSAITWSGTQFVIAGSALSETRIMSPVVLTSANGIDWQQKISESYGALYDVAAIDNTIVAFGMMWEGSGSEEKLYNVFNTVNGVDWRLDLISNSNGKISWVTDRFLAYAPSLFPSTAILSSKDGVSWSRHEVQTYASLTSFTKAADKFIGVGESGAVVTSEDGNTWNSEVPRTGAYFGDILWDNGKFFTVGANGVSSIESEQSMIKTSADGLNWTTVFSEKGDILFDIEKCGAMYVAVGGSRKGFSFNRAVIMSSTDGSSWQRQIAPDENLLTLLNITCIGNRYLALGWVGSASETIAIGNIQALTSSDGVNWLPIATASGSLFYSKGVTASDSTFAVVGYRDDLNGMYKGVIATSVDGVNWQEQEISGVEGFENIAWNGSVFVAVGSQGSSKIAAVSRDGLTWTKQVLATASSHAELTISWTTDQFAVTGIADRLYTSADGVTWRSEALGTSKIRAVAANSERWIGVGEGGAMVSKTSTSDASGGGKMDVVFLIALCLWVASCSACRREAYLLFHR